MYDIFCIRNNLFCDQPICNMGLPIFATNDRNPGNNEKLLEISGRDEIVSNEKKTTYWRVLVEYLRGMLQSKFWKLSMFEKAGPLKLPKFTPRGLTYCCGVSILKSVLWQEYRPAYLAGQAVSAIPSQSSGKSEPNKLGIWIGTIDQRLFLTC